MKKSLLFALAIGAMSIMQVSCSDNHEPNETVIEENGKGEEDSPNYFDIPANTYIVSEAGTYSFSTKKVSGEEIAGIVSADWIWATKLQEDDNEQKLISNVKYKDGKISFNASDNKGCAVIGGFDENHTSLWVWLIWLTDKPQEIECENGAIFLDRGIGATGAKPEDGTKSIPTILYQWGRNVPIFGGYVEEWTTPGMCFREANKWTVINPAMNYKWEVVNKMVTIQESMAAPTTFFTDSKECNWSIGKDMSYWDGKKKTDYDPSPAGYQMPDATIWPNIINKYEVHESPAGATYTYNGNTLWLPSGNMGRHYEDGTYTSDSQYPALTYWNGSAYVDDFDVMIGIPGAVVSYWPSRAILIFDPKVWGQDSNSMANRSFAFAVLPVKSAQ